MNIHEIFTDKSKVIERKQVICELTQAGFFPERKPNYNLGEFYPELRQNRDMPTNQLLAYTLVVTIVCTILHFDLLRYL